MGTPCPDCGTVLYQRIYTVSGGAEWIEHLCVKCGHKSRKPLIPVGTQKGWFD